MTPRSASQHVLGRGSGGGGHGADTTGAGRVFSEAVDGETFDGAARARLDLLKALGDNTRYAIYLELARSPVPLATAEVADSPGPARQHRPPPPRADARGRAARRRARPPGRAGPAPAPLLPRRQRPVARTRTADVPGAVPHAPRGRRPGRRRQRRGRRRRAGAGRRRGGAGARRCAVRRRPRGAARPTRVRSDPGRGRRDDHRRLRPLPVPGAGRGQPRPRVRAAPRARRRLRRRAWAVPRWSPSAPSSTGPHAASRSPAGNLGEP